MRVRPTELEYETLALIWLECPYPVMAVGLAKALEAAGYECCGRKPRGQEPSAVIVCPNVEDIAQKVKDLRDLAPDAPVLVLGLHNDLSAARAALQAGARGFVHLGMSPEQIEHALSWALRGEIVVPRNLVTALIKGEKPPDLRVLTTRQREVLSLVAEGLTNTQIARRLFLAESTVKQRLRGAYKLLGVRNRTEAARLWSNS